MRRRRLTANDILRKAPRAILVMAVAVAIALLATGARWEREGKSLLDLFIPDAGAAEYAFVGVKAGMKLHSGDWTYYDYGITQKGWEGDTPCGVYAGYNWDITKHIAIRGVLEHLSNCGQGKPESNLDYAYIAGEYRW